jgi:hypothetical protein
MECSYETGAGYFDRREALREDRKIGMAFVKKACEIEYSNDEIKYTNIHTSTDIQHFQLPKTVFHATS